MKTLSLLHSKIENKLNIYFSYLIRRITLFVSIWNKDPPQTEYFSPKNLQFYSKNIREFQTKNHQYFSFVQ